jgi:hypothetical protein
VSLLLSTAYCPDVRPRPGRPGQLHGTAEQPQGGLLISLCGRLCNPPESVCEGGYIPQLHSICRSCLRDKDFEQKVRAALRPG